MSNNYYETDKVTLTAFVGGEKYKGVVQITLPNERYELFSREEAYELAINLLLRTSGLTSATNDGENGIYLEDEK